jgi:endonuclease YncB( thermonuclease family)
VSPGAALLLAALAAAALPAAASRATVIEGRVSYVADGDSLGFAPARGGPPLQVRLHGVDAPELCQAWGPEARAALLRMVEDRALRLQVRGRDEHGRLIAQLRHGEVDIGQRLVADGHAWSHRYRHDRGPYVQQERIAQALGRGLHAEPGVLTPREFRRRHGACPPAAAR